MIFTSLRTIKRALQLSIVVAAISCGEPRQISGFDSQTWKDDRHGCQGKRAQIWQQFSAGKGQLMGYSENDLKFLLGKAEKSELMERGQKLYFYDISGSDKCGKQAADQQPLQLLVRVNSLNKVSEVQAIKPR